ncbi:MAG: polyphosphate polymerase domain-containing protein [Mogibacterium sp.]|nr:polyphosphate polymerase domain-containing protein [Mogibacterium sp.]
MAYQKVFKRYELKYMLTQDQKERILKAMEPYMMLDKFGRSTIRNIYFDTDDYILARHSIAKPDYKEKLRIRSYSRVEGNDKVFVELKRKFDHVVYKRRIALPETDAMAWTTGARRMTSLNDLAADAAGTAAGSIRPVIEDNTPQLSDEINYFLDYYKDLKPAVFLSYDREAYKMRKGASDADGGSDFRVTFDENILCRDYDLSLRSDVYGTPVLQQGKVLMELKCSGVIPLWMVKVLSEEKVYKTSFSKYGTAYTNIILPELLAAAHAAQAADERDALAAKNAAAGRHSRTSNKHSQRRWFGGWRIAGSQLFFSRRTA